MKGYQNRQATMDRINARWDRTIREVEVYHNPNTGENIELSSGYGSGWVNKSGECRVGKCELQSQFGLEWILEEARQSQSVITRLAIVRVSIRSHIT